MIKRDLTAEQRAVGTFQGNNRRLPDLNNPTERAAVYRLAYPPTSGGLPDELKGTVDESLYAATGMNAPLSQTVDGSNLSQLQGNVQSAQAEVQKTSQPNTAMQVLQDAIRAKSGMATQGIGESSLFKEAGVTGIGALSQSIAAQGSKLDSDFANFSNIVGKMSGTYKDMANTALNNYTMAYQAYKDESDRLQKITSDAQQHAEALDIINQQYENSLKLEQYKRMNPDINDVIAGQDAGLVQDESGNWVTQPDGIINSPSGHTYDLSAWATDPSQPASVQRKLDEMGKLETPEDLTRYLNEFMPSSGITANDVMSAAEANGVGWEELLAITALESTNGTSNVFKKNNNPSGITWNTNFPESMKGTPRPASEGGNYVKFPTIADGLAYTAKNLARPLYKQDQVSVGEAATDELTASTFVANNIKALFGGNASDADREEMLKIYKGWASQGLDQAQILNKITGFDIKDPEDFDFAEKIKNLVVTNLPDKTSFKDAGAKEYADLINAGKYTEAITKAENRNYDAARKSLGEDYVSEVFARTTITQANQLESLINQLEATGKEPIGNFKGSFEKWLGRFRSGDAAKIAAQITQMVAPMRSKLLGSAITKQEETTLEPIIPSLGDTTENILTKISSLKAAPLLKLNSIRTQYGMPEVNEGSVIRPGEKVSLYGEKIDVSKFQQTLSKTKAADGSLLTQAEIDQLVNEAKTLASQGKTAEEIQAAINYALGY